MTPGGKAAIIQKLKDSGHLVMAIGSSQNDEQAMALSDFSLALGTPLASADMYSIHADPKRIADIFRLAKQAREIYRQNLLLARAGNVIGIGLAFFKIFNSATAMFGQKILSLIMLANAGRLRWVEEQAEKEMRPDREHDQAAATGKRWSPWTGMASWPQCRDRAAGSGRPGASGVPALKLPALLQTLQVEPRPGACPPARRSSGCSCTGRMCWWNRSRHELLVADPGAVG